MVERDFRLFQFPVYGQTILPVSSVPGLIVNDSISFRFVFMFEPQTSSQFPQTSFCSRRKRLFRFPKFRRSGKRVPSSRRVQDEVAVSSFQLLVMTGCQTSFQFSGFVCVTFIDQNEFAVPQSQKYVIETTRTWFFDSFVVHTITT